VGITERGERRFGTEAGQAIIKAVQLPTLRANPLQDNLASHRLLVRLGFRLCGHGHEWSVSRYRYMRRKICSM
jgi:RimJ/RimL family protein N-acetyltransferase